MDNRTESCCHVNLVSSRAVGQLVRTCTVVQELCLQSLRQQAVDVWILQRCKFMGVGRVLDPALSRNGSWPLGRPSIILLHNFVLSSNLIT